MFASLVALVAFSSDPPPPPIPRGADLRTVEVAGVRLPVYTYKPEGYRDGPLLLVFHGLDRDARRYRDSARGLADRLGAVVAAPEFADEHFPYARYTRGNVLRSDGSPAPRDDWTWPLVPKLADALRRREGRPDMPYHLLGHSAGGQFVGRMAGFIETGATRLVASNSGSYLAPNRDEPFPYGFGGLPEPLSGDDAIRRYLAQPLTLYLGTADTRRDDDLDTSPPADRQGPTRLERGRRVYEQARALAAARGWAFRWRKVEAPGIGHNAAAMFDSPLCAEALDGPPEPADVASRRPAPAGAGQDPVGKNGEDGVTNSLGMKLVRIPAGEFWMGAEDDAQALAAAYPEYDENRIQNALSDCTRHRVRITRPFFMGAHEVTIGQFRQFLTESGYRVESERDGTGGWGIDLKTKEWVQGRRPQFSWKNPGFPQGDDHPVTNVTWNDAVAFCRWLGRKEARTYRLPTEAEWEYACRAGTTTRYNTGADPTTLAGSANLYDAASAAVFPEWARYALRSDDGYPFTAPVGRYRPNAWGLFDMHGNVWEWCSDWYGEDYYTRSPLEDPQGPPSGTRHSRRGGAWHTWPLYTRAAYRNYNTPQSRYLNLGLRVVMEVSR